MSWRIISIPLVILAAVLGIALHWHIVFYQKVVEPAKPPAPKPHYAAMTRAHCEAITNRSTRREIEALYGPDQAVDAKGAPSNSNPGLQWSPSKTIVFYNVNPGGGCLIAYRNDRVYQVWEELR
jgi:hypothetical protein